VPLIVPPEAKYEMSPITTHVLDISRGCPAIGLAVSLERLLDAGWKQIAAGVTNRDGRITDWWEDGILASGEYRLTFATERYFRESAIADFFYPEIIVQFRVSEGRQHYHVPLLLSPFGYSTYRGS
jgi:5-hydroxyisourate hydrolase